MALPGRAGAVERKGLPYAARTDHPGAWAATDNLVDIARAVPALDAERDLEAEPP